MYTTIAYTKIYNIKKTKNGKLELKNRNINGYFI